MDGDQAAGTARESTAGAAAAGPGYRRREPERSLLYETVRSYWNTLLAEVAQRTDGGSLPRFVVAEFERYLSCGILANGFARVHCDACGKDMLVAFSCRGRGFCPSCTTRRMQGTALHLVDRVIPRVPVRQWVLSLPRWARFLLARDPALITRTLDLYLREIFNSHRRRARREGARAPRGLERFRSFSALALRSISTCIFTPASLMASSSASMDKSASSRSTHPRTTR